MGVTLNPIRFMRRRRRLRQAVDDEVYYLRRAHGGAAYTAAVFKLGRRDLTSWGRRVLKGAALELKRTEDVDKRRSAAKAARNRAADPTGLGHLHRWGGKPYLLALLPDRQDSLGQFDDLLDREGLVLEHRLGEAARVEGPVDIAAPSLVDPSLHSALDLFVDLLGRFRRDLLKSREGMPDEDLLLVIAIGDPAKLSRKPAQTEAAAGDRGAAFVVRTEEEEAPLAASNLRFFDPNARRDRNR
jgi:hypothetical protein